MKLPGTDISLPTKPVRINGEDHIVLTWAAGQLGITIAEALFRAMRGDAEVQAKMVQARDNLAAETCSCGAALVKQPGLGTYCKNLDCSVLTPAADADLEDPNEAWPGGPIASPKELARARLFALKGAALCHANPELLDTRGGVPEATAAEALKHARRILEDDVDSSEPADHGALWDCIRLLICAVEDQQIEPALPEAQTKLCGDCVTEILAGSDDDE